MRHTRAPRNGNPDLRRKLRSNVVESEGRKEADHRPRDGAAGSRQIVVLRRAWSPRQTISSWANLLERTGPRHPRECACVNALTSHVPGTHDGLLLGKAEKLADGALTLRRFAYTH